jgi:GT2 family glycosyltransferase
VDVIETGENLGYAGGMNAGLARAAREGARYVWLLNNDTAPEPAALGALVRCAEVRARTGAVASLGRTRSDTGDIRSYPTAFRYRRSQEIPVACRASDDADADHLCHAADVVTGGSLFLRLEAIADVGQFDEAYFHYAEEKDLAERMRRAGWGARLSCDSIVWHQRGGSLDNQSPQATYYYIRSQLRFRRRLWGEHPLRVLVRDRAIRRLLRVRPLLHGDLRFAVATGLAIWDALRGRTGRRELGPRFLHRGRGPGRGPSPRRETNVPS